jgi:hypothetical protein
MSSSRPCHQVVHVISGMWGLPESTGNQVTICSLHLYKERCFCMYQDVVTPEQRLLCGLSNVSADGKNVV